MDLGKFEPILEQEVLTRQQVLDFIVKNRNQPISIVFIKKDGTKRILNGVTGVRRGVTGKGLKYNPHERGYVIVYDTNKRGYRTVNIGTATDFKTKDGEFKIDENVDLQPIRFKTQVYNLYGGPAWLKWRRFADINRRNTTLESILDFAKQSDYRITSRQQQYLVKWYNGRR